MRLPAVVGECLVGFGHLVDVFLALERSALARGGVENLVGEALGHVLLAALAGVVDDPPHSQRAGATGTNLDRHLVGGATHPAGTDLDRRPDVLDGLLQNRDRIRTGALLDELEGAVDDGASPVLLALPQDLVDELGDQHATEQRIRFETLYFGGGAAHGPQTFLAP